jgi:hypothetical protein
MTTIDSLRQVTTRLDATLERTARRPDVKREADYYLAHIGSIRTLDAFMANDRLYRFAMQAHGLEELTYAKALIRRVLSEGPSRSDALANRLADPRFREIATVLDFGRLGSATTSFTRAQQGTVDKYVRQALEVETGQQSEGLRLALYFQRKAPEVTSAYGLLADRALLKVTQIALGLPAQSSSLDIEKQADLISQRLTIGDLKSPDKLGRLLDRFAARWDIENPTSTSVPPVTGLGSSSAAAGIDATLLARIQTLGRGR